MDNQTRELIENVIAIGVEYGVDIVGAIVLLVVGWTVAGWIRRVIRRTLDRVPALDETLKPFIANLVRYVVLIFVLIAVLNQFGIQTTSIIAVLAAAGLAIGLALQGTLANVSSGVMLLFLRPFNVGEYVKAGDIAGTAPSGVDFRSKLTSVKVEGRKISFRWEFEADGDTSHIEMTAEVASDGMLKGYWETDDSEGKWEGQKVLRL